MITKEVTLKLNHYNYLSIEIWTLPKPQCYQIVEGVKSTLRGHPFSTCAKFSKKLTFLTADTHKYGSRNLEYLSHFKLNGNVCIGD